LWKELAFENRYSIETKKRIIEMTDAETLTLFISCGIDQRRAEEAIKSKTIKPALVAVINDVSETINMFKHKYWQSFSLECQLFFKIDRFLRSTIDCVVSFLAQAVYFCNDPY
jgi:hypothetical protein